MFWVKKEAFFNSLAEDSDICISFTAAFGGALTLELVMLGVMPLMNLCKVKAKIKAEDDIIVKTILQFECTCVSKNNTSTKLILLHPKRDI